MNIRILNRAGKLPDDGYYQIEAPGEHVNHAARVVQVIDAAAVDSIVNRFTAEAAKAGDDFAGLLIDRDHLSQSMENPTEAVGWMMAIRNRDGIPEAKVAWTALGRPLVESKEGQPPVYKFFSTEYEPTQCQKIGTRIINRKSYDLVRPLRLDGLSLTNDPNNKGQRPISNRTTATTAETDGINTTMKALLKNLGLAEDASEESAVAAVESIRNRATKAEGQVTSLTTERDALLNAQVENDLEKYKNRFKAENRPKVKAQLIANRTSTIELLEAIEQPAATSPRITNRGTATPPNGGKVVAGEEDEAAKARKITNRANELKGAAPGRPWDSCWNQAASELTETAGN